MSDRDTQIQKLTVAAWGVGDVTDVARRLYDAGARIPDDPPGYPARNPVQRAKEMLASLTEAQRTEVLKVETVKSQNAGDALTEATLDALYETYYKHPASAVRPSVYHAIRKHFPDLLRDLLAVKAPNGLLYVNGAQLDANDVLAALGVGGAGVGG